MHEESLETMQHPIQPQSALELPRDRVGRVRWVTLKDEPEALTKILEDEASSFLAGGNRLVRSQLRKAGLQNLASAIARHYPGGLIGLRTNLGIEYTRNELPKRRWVDSDIIQEAEDFYQQAGGLTHNLLDKNRRSDLRYVITERYPGGIRQLRQDLHLTQERSRKAFDYWSPEKIEQEALEFYQSEGRLAYQFLKSRGRSDLSSAIWEHYPGGLLGLKEKLGIISADAVQIITPDEANEQLAKLVEGA